VQLQYQHSQHHVRDQSHQALQLLTNGHKVKKYGLGHHMYSLSVDNITTAIKVCHRVAFRNHMQVLIPISGFGSKSNCTLCRSVSPNSPCSASTCASSRTRSFGGSSTVSWPLLGALWCLSSSCQSCIVDRYPPTGMVGMANTQPNAPTSKRRITAVLL